MTDTIAGRLEKMGVTLPEAAQPAANYLSYVISGSTLHISGQLPFENGKVTVTGHLGKNVEVEAGQKAARLCAIHILAQAKAALGGELERIKRVVKITGFVASTPDFTTPQLVVNGASDFLVEALGERGRHARCAVGMATLPLGAAVEVDAIIEIA